MKSIKIRSFNRGIYIEAGIWLVALIFLAISNPAKSQSFSLCLLHNLNIDYCPGCGLGRSISWIFRGDIMNSLKSHPLGIAVTIALIFRIFAIIYKRF